MVNLNFGSNLIKKLISNTFNGNKSSNVSGSKKSSSKGTAATNKSVGVNNNAKVNGNNNYNNRQGISFKQPNNEVAELLIKDEKDEKFTMRYPSDDGGEVKEKILIKNKNLKKVNTKNMQLYNIFGRYANIKIL